MIEKISLSELDMVKQQLYGAPAPTQPPVNANPTPPPKNEINNKPEPSNDQLLRKIEILEQIKDSCFELIQINEILPTTYIRISSAIDYVIYQLMGNDTTGIEENTFVSLEALSEIQAMAKPVVMDKNDIKIKELMEFETYILYEYLDYAMGKENNEIDEQDIDDLLTAFKNADKQIDNKQN